MNDILNRNLFFVKEHVGMFKAANNYDILDPNNQELIMTCREENLGGFTKILRFTDYKRMTPFEIEIKTQAGENVLTVKRGVSIFLSKVEVLDQNNKLVGSFKQKFFSIGAQEENDFIKDDLVGMKFNFLIKEWKKSNDSSVNYIATFLKN